MSEWFKEPVLKTGDPSGPWVRIPLSPPRRSKASFAPAYFLSAAENKPFARLRLLFRKKSRLAHLFRPETPHSGSLPLPTFREFERSTPAVETPKISFSCGLDKKGTLTACLSFWVPAAFDRLHLLISNARVWQSRPGAIPGCKPGIYVSLGARTPLRLLLHKKLRRAFSSRSPAYLRRFGSSILSGV